MSQITHVTDADFNTALKKAKEDFVFNIEPSYLNYSEATYNGYTYGSSPYDWITKVFSRYQGVKVNATYRDFEKKLVHTIFVATNPDTKEKFVTFTELHDSKVQILPISDFLVWIDPNKYPSTTQELRYELV